MPGKRTLTLITPFFLIVALELYLSGTQSGARLVGLAGQESGLTYAPGSRALTSHPAVREHVHDGPQQDLDVEPQ